MQPPHNNHHSPLFWDEKGEFHGLEGQWEFWKDESAIAHNGIQPGWQGQGEASCQNFHYQGERRGATCANHPPHPIPAAGSQPG